MVYREYIKVLPIYLKASLLFRTHIKNSKKSKVSSKVSIPLIMVSVRGLIFVLQMYAS